LTTVAILAYAIIMIESKLDQQRKNIDPKVWKQLRVVALEDGKTIAEVIELALMNEFKRRLEVRNEK
jgi:hypothetical protein